MNIFEAQTPGLFSTYAVRLQCTGRLLGGIPKDPGMIEAWLRTKAGISDTEEVRQAMLRTLVDLGADVNSSMSYDDLVAASKSLAAQQQTSGFKRNDTGLYIEERQIKAAVKEAVNILYAGERWGKTKKGPRNFTAERVFVTPDEISLGRKEADGVELSIIHVDSKGGPRNALSYHEYVTTPQIAFQIRVLRDEIEHERWPEIWVLASYLGLGAKRSQGYGKFSVVAWDLVK